MKLAAVTLGSLLLTACGGGGSAAPTATSAPCTVAPDQISLAYPTGTNVSASNVSGVWLAGTPSLPAALDVELVGSNGVTQELDAINGAATPPSGYTPVSGAQYYQSTFPTGFTLSSSTTYAVYYLNVQQGGCAWTDLTSFTTN